MIIMPYGWPRPIAAAHRPGRLLAPHRPSRCRLPGCLLIVSPWPLTAETRQPARQDCLTRPTRQWLRYPGASRAGPGADRATDRQLAESSSQHPPQRPPPDPAAPARGSKTSSRDPAHSRSSQLIKPWPALAVARSMAGIADCVATPAMTPSMRWPRAETVADGKIGPGSLGWPVIAAWTVGKISRCWVHTWR
jgi:hypothetical protein